MQTVKQLIDANPNKKVWQLIDKSNYCQNYSSVDENDKLVWGVLGKATKCSMLNWMAEMYEPQGLYQDKIEQLIKTTGIDYFILNGFCGNLEDVKEKLKLADI